MTIPRRLVPFAAFLSFAATMRAATAPDSVPEHEIVAIKFSEGETSATVNSFEIDWDKRTFARRKIRVYPTTGGVLFTGKPGLYDVTVVGAGTFEQLQVEIVAATPTPGPKPPPKPDPSPTPVDPTVPNTHGVGKLSYDRAKAINDPKTAGVLADIYLSASSSLAAKSGDLIDDITSTTTAIKSQSMERLANPDKWRPLTEELKRVMMSTWNAGVQDRATWVAIFSEIGLALKEVK